MKRNAFGKMAAGVAALTILLTACGSTTPTSNGTNETSQTVSAGGVTTEGFDFLPYYDNGFAADDGLYHYRVQEDCTKQICYVDFATGQDVVLCNQLNCTHDSEACNAWISASSPSWDWLNVIPVGDKVLLLRGFWKNEAEEHSSRAEIMNPDGTDRHLVKEFPLNVMIGGAEGDGVVRDQENLYFAGNNTETNLNTVYRCNIHTEKIESVCQLEKENEALIGGVDNSLLTCYVPGWAGQGNDVLKSMTKKIVKIDLATGERQEFLEHSAADYGICKQDRYYLINATEQTICSWDLHTGAMEQHPLSEPECLDWEIGVYPLGFYDGKLLLRNKFDEECYAVEASTGEMTKLDHTYAVKNPDVAAMEPEQLICYVAAETKDGFLITAEKEEQPCQGIDEAGLPFQTVREAPTYRLISKVDFWNNQGNGTPIVDARD